MAILKKVWIMSDLVKIAGDVNSYASQSDLLLCVSRETGNCVFIAERVTKPNRIDVRLPGEWISNQNAVEGRVEQLWKYGASFTILVKKESEDTVVIWKRQAKK